MLTFKEFQENNQHSPFKQQKRCYEWYLRGMQSAAGFISKKFNSFCDQRGCCEDICSCIDDALESFADKFSDLEEINAETEEN